VIPAILLSPSVYDTLINVAQAAQPNEACGLLVGRGERVVQVIPVENSAEDKITHFQITQQALNDHLPSIRQQGLTIIGFFHSHPNGYPVPSAEDIQQNRHLDYLQVIIGLAEQTPKIAAWHIQPDSVIAVPVVFNEDEQHQMMAATWTDVQKVVIILTAFMAAFALMIVSINLLPPAP
jgi:proteasome lid subunit RPN8/RPN11